MQPNTPINDRKKCVVYVDGFNLYWGILRHHPEWKWLNLQSFFEALRPDEDVRLVKYFTAIVEPDKWDSSKRKKQSSYLKVFGSTPKVAVILGKFQLRDSTCKADCKKKYKVAEEKKTDVNIAVNLIDDAIKGKVESAIIVSGDSDLEPAVHWVRQNHPGIKVTVYIPCLPDERFKRRNDFYPTIGVTCKFLTLAEFENHQFPDVVALPDGKSENRPDDW
jgi:uncharacterized LabA/DUF88 family protein